ncbi:MAG: ammonium transporter [Oscillospiraceae bacterium]|jgi:Amt family ammonium transporter|nr:ammonium transporter [Oscillospiraceae bacterium]
MEYSLIDTLWVVLAAILVFFMNLGFAAVESGFARAKNTVNILSKNFIVFAVSSLGFMLLGWGLMFGGDNPVIGTQNLWILGKSTAELENAGYTLSANVPFWVKFFFQLVFCGTAATIVSGAVAERIKYISFIVFSFFLTLVIYPIVGHWIWGGGWLAKLGFQDFAGGTTVHSLGGWAALAGVLVLGPRHGKYGKDGKVNPIMGHNMSLAVIGLFVLWLGWFGFNPGSTMSFQNPGDVAHVLVTTNTAAVVAVLTSTAAAWIFIGKPDISMTVNGCLAGLVAITPGCAYISVGGSVIIGAIAGALVVFLVLFFDRIKIDDPVGATSVHLGCGVFGSICVGLFAQEGVTTLSPANGLFYGGGAGLLGTQLIGIAVVAVFTFAVSLLIWILIKKTLGIRVSLQEEIEGLDISEHGNFAYPDFTALAPAMSGSGGDAVMPAAAATGKSAAPASAPAAVHVTNTATPGAKITRVSIITNQNKLSGLQAALEAIGITGMTVTNVLGYGMQRGQPEVYRGARVETRLLPKVQLDIVICKVPTDVLVNTVKAALYTGSVGDGKMFIYDVENVIKVRTGEEGYAALQDE